MDRPNPVAPLLDMVLSVSYPNRPDVLSDPRFNTLVAISPALRNVAPSALRPQPLWNVDRL